MDLYIQNNTKEDIAAYEETIKKCIENTLNYENFEIDIEVSVLIVDDAQIKNLNAFHRGKDSITDVLSFPQYSKLELEQLKNKKIGASAILGDIVINIFKCYEQAERFCHSVEREVGFLVVHSVLHLLGYNHIEPEQEAKMDKAQETILDKMGLRR